MPSDKESLHKGPSHKELLDKGPSHKGPAQCPASDPSTWALAGPVRPTPWQGQGRPFSHPGVLGGPKVKTQGMDGAGAGPGEMEQGVEVGWKPTGGNRAEDDLQG